MKKNKQVLDFYKDIVDSHYDERKETSKVASFQESQGMEPPQCTSKSKEENVHVFHRWSCHDCLYEKRCIIIFL